MALGINQMDGDADPMTGCERHAYLGTVILPYYKTVGATIVSEV